jgi:glycerophosphoryl diester phosphodiesterase
MLYEGVNLWLQQFSVPWLDRFFLVVSSLGSGYVYLLFLTFVYWCVSRRSGRTLVLAFLASVWLNSVLKDSLGIPRPSGDLLRVLAYEWSSGFPSGHTQMATTVWGYLAFRWRSRVMSIIALTIVFFISVSRLYLGLHDLAQVLGGVALGLAVAFLAARWERPSAPARPNAWQVVAIVFFSYLAGVPVQSDDGFRIAGIAMGFLLTDPVAWSEKRNAKGEYVGATVAGEAALAPGAVFGRVLVGWLGFVLGHNLIGKVIAPGLPAMLAYGALAVWCTAGVATMSAILGLGVTRRPPPQDTPPYPIPAPVPLPSDEPQVSGVSPLFAAVVFSLLAAGLTLASLDLRVGLMDAIPAEVQRSDSARPSLPIEEPVAILGHKGAAGLAPENTLVGFDRALKEGAHILELDVRRSLDGQVVVFHDERLDALTDGTGAVRKLTMADLGQLDAGYWFTTDGVSYPYRGRGLRIPTLESVLRAYPSALFNIEMKDYSPDMPHALLAVLRATASRGRVIVASFDGPTIHRFRQLAPDIPTALAKDEVKRLVVMARLGVGIFFKPPARYLQIPERLGLIQLATPSTFRLADRIGMDVHVWTVNSPIAMQRLIEGGVDGIITDYPDRLAEVLSGRPPNGKRAPQ